MSADSPAPPDRRALRTRLFWAVRWMVGRSVYYTGAIRILIDDGRTPAGEMLVIQPLFDDEPVDAEGPPSRSPASLLAPKLLSRFMSPDGLAIMRHIASRGSVPAKAIATGVGIERSKCYVLIIELRDRGLIRDTPDGYVIADVEVWAACGAVA